MIHNFTIQFELTREAAMSGVEAGIEDLFVFMERYLRHQPGLTKLRILGNCSARTDEN